ncbi:PAS domain S-box protein [Halorubellus sp. JP-L1]|uniref:PAS domain S-box protein n=1 Tax=Halorubellus sp. JP-L1 TaxID=2715753 RepID=UPI0014098979|nr:PAS domain S-box protein [Halorubellus sp. JP-L1]NHN43472.1 PAS domain S-box protein [Halorubellus sp. JP-L1]
METTSLSESLRETLARFDAGGAPRTTPEVAEDLDLGRRSTYERLERLAERDLLETKKVGANARVWWQPVGASASDRAGPESGTTQDDAGRDDGSTRETDAAEFQALVDAVEEYAIFMLDVDGRVRTWNPGARSIKGYEVVDVVGEHFSTFYTEADVDEGVPEANLEAAATEGETEDEGWRVRADGTRFWANVTITAIRDDEGDLQGFAKVTRDMTERHRHEEELHQQRDFTQEILETAPVGVLVVEPDGTFEPMNKRANELLGIDEGGPYNVGHVRVYDENGALLLPEERPYVHAFETGEPVRDVHLSVPLPEGGQRWLSANVEPLTVEDGSVEEVLVTIEDVTQLKEQTERLERHRDDLASELDEVFERIDDGFYAVDEAFRFTYVNERAEELLQHDEAELLGRSVWSVFPDATETPAYDAFHTALETQEPTSYDVHFDVLDFWVEAHVYPSENGLSVYFRDVTDQRERENELELYETIFSEARDGIYVLDDRFCFSRVNDAYVEMTGYDREELLGAHSSLVVDEDVVQDSARSLQEVFRGERDSATLEADIQRADGGTLRAESKFTGMPNGDGDGHRKLGFVRDVSERVARERELEESRRRYETIVDHFPNGAVALVDENLDYVTVGGTPPGEGSLDRDELQGGHVADVLPAELADLLDPAYERAFDGESSQFEATIDGSDYQFHVVPIRDDDGVVFSAMGMSQDVTERKAYERELEVRMQQQRATADLGQEAIESNDLDDLFEQAATVVADVLGNDYCKVLDLDADAEELLLRQGVGWQDGVVGAASVSATEDDSQASYTLSIDEPVVVEDLETETRFSGTDLLTDHDVSSGISVIVGTRDDPWGILGTHDTDTKQFTPHDVDFVQAVANILATAIERDRQERALAQQREQLQALNSLNEVVQGITDAVIDQSTREEIEATVVEGLAAVDSFSFAWIGDADSATREVTPRAQADAGDYLEGFTISVDPDDDLSRGPTAQALLTGEMQVTQDVAVDDSHDPWREHVDAYEFRSSAAIPIVHEETTYGVLNVYADRPFAFEDAERRVLDQLGEVVGHAIAAVDRKRALMSDEVVELEFRIADFFGAFDIEDAADGRITLDEVVPTSDGNYLVYGTAAEEARPLIDRLVDAIPHWTSVTDRGQWGDTCRFELQLTDSPVLWAIASSGGYVDEAVVEDGDYHMTIHLPPTVDTRSVADTVMDAYPTADLVAQRQRSRTAESAGRLERMLVEELTERQRAALESAYRSGFFEWPRESDGQTVAESLGVSPPTFHQHLRKAERKVFDALLSESAAT